MIYQKKKKAFDFKAFWTAKLVMRMLILYHPSFLGYYEDNDMLATW